MPDLQLLVWGKMANKTLRTIQAAKIVSFSNINHLTTYYQPAYETFQMYGTYFKILKKFHKFHETEQIHFTVIRMLHENKSLFFTLDPQTLQTQKAALSCSSSLRT